MNNKRHFILSSLGALSMLNAGASGIENNKQFYNSTSQFAPQQSNFGMPQVNPGLNKKVINTNVQQQKTSDIKGRVISGVGGGLVGFVAGNALQHFANQHAIEELSSQIDYWKKTVEQVEKTAECKDLQINSLNSDKSKLNDSIEKLKKLDEKLKQKIDNLESQIQTLENSDDKNKKITELQGEVQNLRDKYNDMEAKSKKYEKALSSTSDLLLKLGEHSYLILKDLYSDFTNSGKVKFESVAELALLNYFVRQAKKQTLIACGNVADDEINHFTRNRDEILMNSEYTTYGFRDYVNDYSWNLNGINGNKKYSGGLYDSVKNSEDLKTVAENLIKEQLK